LSTSDPTLSPQVDEVSIYTGTNNAPVANDQAVVANVNTALPITLTASDVDGTTLTYTVADGPTNGVLSGTAPNLTYTPNANYAGADSFTFRANDGTVDSNLATVSITVNPENEAPVADDQSVVTDEDIARAIVLTASDADGDALTYTVVDGPANGVLTGTPPDLTYTPNLDYAGADSFTFRANDGTADSNLATVSITVNPVNDAPLAFLPFVCVNNGERARAVILEPAWSAAHPRVH
jgi:hypothetical protein